MTLSLEMLRRNVYTTSSCGVCGKASLEAVEAVACTALPEGPVVPGTFLRHYPTGSSAAQAAFDRTGGLHAAGLFDDEGRRLVVREDVGRHNAVDKVIGHRLLARPTGPDPAVLVVSGRASFELVQKAVLAGVPILLAVGARPAWRWSWPSSSDKRWSASRVTEISTSTRASNAWDERERSRPRSRPRGRGEPSLRERQGGGRDRGTHVDRPRIRDAQRGV